MIKGPVSELLEKLKELFSEMEIDVGKWLRLARGLAILIIAVLILSYTTDYVLHNKIEMRFGLSGFENLVAKAPSFESIMAARGLQAFMAAALMMMVMTLIAMLTGRDLNLVKLLTLIGHSFIIVIIFTSLQVPFILQIPKTPYVIVDASLENVTFQQASLIGISPEGELKITSEVIRAAHARVFRAYPNATIPNWILLERGGIKGILENTLTYMNLSNVRWISEGVEMKSESLDLCVGNWSDVKYERLLSRTPIRLSREITFHEQMLSIFSLLSTVGLAAFSTIGFKRLYQASLKLTVVVGVLLLLVLFFFGSF